MVPTLPGKNIIITLITPHPPPILSLCSELFIIRALVRFHFQLNFYFSWKKVNSFCVKGIFQRNLLFLLYISSTVNFFFYVSLNLFTLIF